MSDDAEREEQPAAASTAGEDFGAGYGEKDEAGGSEKGDDAPAAAGGSNGVEDLAKLVAGRQLNVKDMRPQRNGMNLVVKVLKVAETRSVPTRSGGQRKIMDLLVGDSTGVALFSAKDAQCDKMAPGKVVRLQNATVEVFRSTMRLVVDRGIGEIEEAADQDAASFAVREEFNLSLIEFDTVVNLDDL